MRKRDSVRENAIARRDAALAEAKRWEDFLRLYDELGSAGGPGSITSLPTKTFSVQTRSHFVSEPQAGSRVSETEERAREILKRSERPLATKEILRRLEATGFKIDGQNPVATLHTRLSRSGSLQFVRPEGWHLRDRSGALDQAETTGAASSAVAAADHATPSLPLNDADRRGGDHDAS